MPSNIMQNVDLSDFDALYKLRVEIEELRSFVHPDNSFKQATAMMKVHTAFQNVCSRVHAQYDKINRLELDKGGVERKYAELKESLMLGRLDIRYEFEGYRVRDTEMREKLLASQQELKDVRENETKLRERWWDCRQELESVRERLDGYIEGEKAVEAKKAGTAKKAEEI